MKWFLRRAAVLTVTAAIAVVAAGSAGAQVSRSLSVAVLTFGNSSGVGGALLGSRATAAMETQLIDSGRYDVVKRDLVNKTMTDLNLTPPLGRAGIAQLAQALEADNVITGDVTKVTKNPKTNQVSVTLRVEVTDRSSGELVNGAIATGESGIRPDFTGAEDILIDEALNKAAFTAVRSMNERILPEGTVFATSTREGQIEALLNIGSNSGVRQGMEFIVLRNREQVGRIRITSVTPSDSTAAVISTTRGVQPEDKVRAVFRLENIPADLGGTAQASSTYHRPKANLGNVFLGLGALAGLYALNHGRLGSGAAGPRNVHAYPSGPFNGAPVSDVLPEAPSVHVRLSPPIGVKVSDIYGYVIYQDIDTTNALAVIDGAARDVYIDGNAVTVDPKGVNSNIGAAKGNANGPDVGRPLHLIIRTYYNYTGTGTGTGTGGTGTGGTGTTTAPSINDVQTPLVTFIVPPIANGNQAVSDYTAVQFSFQRVPGADRYIIQVATNPNFTNAEQFPSSDEGFIYPALPSVGTLAINNGTSSDTSASTYTRTVYSALPTDTFYDASMARTGVFYTTTQTVDLLHGRIDPQATNQVLYWRVGARDSRDAERPENGGWVWGNYNVFNPSGTGTGTGTGSVKTQPVPVTPPVAVTPPSPVGGTVPGDVPIRGGRGPVGRGGRFGGEVR